MDSYVQKQGERGFVCWFQLLLVFTKSILLEIKAFILKQATQYNTSQA